MRRRRFVKYGAGVCSVAVLSGCVSEQQEPEDTGDAGQTASSDRDPQQTVRDFLNAIEAGERETVAELVHPDGKLADRVDLLVENGETVEFETVQTEMAAQGGDRAFVDVAGEGHSEEGSQVTIETVYELRTGDDKWRMYANPGKVPVEYRLEDVAPAESFEARIGRSAENAEVLFTAADVAAVDLNQSQTPPSVAVSFSGDRAEQIQETASSLGSELNTAEIFEYLGGERVRTREVSPELARLIRSGDWATGPELTLSYDDPKLVERVAATLLDEGSG